MKRILLLMILVAGFAACRGGSPARTADAVGVTSVAEIHNSRNSLDWSGTYEGVLPCADCEGIRTTVTLTSCDRYNVKTQYLGKGDTTVYETEGRIDWEPNGNVVKLEGLEDAPRKYQVAEGRLFVLDMDGNRIESTLADHYILTKKD